MSIEIKAPTFPESVPEGTIATWHKQPGDVVTRDELLVDIETDKVVLEVVAPSDGTLTEVMKGEGDVVLSGELIARLEPGKVETADNEPSQAIPVEVKAPAPRDESRETADITASPSARKLASEANIDLSAVHGSGKGGLITKEDVLSFKSDQVSRSEQSARQKAAERAPEAEIPVSASAPPLSLPGGERIEKRVPMTRMRARIAERLLSVTQNTAMLTTFNEVDMHRVMDLRADFKDQFAKAHNGTRLGFMGFFVKASVEALKRFPLVNASIDGSDVVYHGYQDIGVAVSTERGLVVPVLRNAENMSIAEIESAIVDFGDKAKNNKLTIEEMTGGTFSISNGGVFGSLLSTPILNPPQSAILGMHTIQQRPVVENGEIVIRPMMYLALSYDHRIIDGKEAVGFLVAIKDMIENPAKILLEI